jgi:hypothetical protein
MAKETATGGPCRDCVYYAPSSLPEYGYCQAGPTLDERARLKPSSTLCRFAFRFVLKRREEHVQ